MAVKGRPDVLELPEVTAGEREMARVAQRFIMEALDHSRAPMLTLKSSGTGQPSIDVPPSMLKVLGQLLGLVKEGRPVMLVPRYSEFTTVEAANFLNVSRPFVVKEIDAGRLAHRMVGTHRRIACEDLIAYERKMREKQTRALERLAETERELGLDY